MPVFRHKYFMNFNQLNIIQPILKALQDVGYEKPTDIQSKAITPILEGKDLLGCARTGTGKTAAFAIPILQQLHGKARSSKPRALVLTPTRELALQVEENFRLYGKYLHVSCTSIFGGVAQGRQVQILSRGVDIIVATPGRLLDLTNQGFINLSQLEILVLDEADTMLDMGFLHDVKKILTKIPKEKQTLFFSATMPRPIQTFAESLLKNPVSVFASPVSSAAPKVDQSVFFVDKNQKPDLLVKILRDVSIERSLVFTRTKHGADKLVKQLAKTGILAAAIHGNKSQPSRQKALLAFKKNQIRVLVATDIASRGIDIDELPHVVNFELPNVPETYVHRIGRTGRAGKSGTAISFCDIEEKNNLNQIQKLIGFTMPVKKAHAVMS